MTLNQTLKRHYDFAYVLTLRGGSCVKIFNAKTRRARRQFKKDANTQRIYCKNDDLDMENQRNADRTLSGKDLSAVNKGMGSKIYLSVSIFVLSAPVWFKTNGYNRLYG